MTQIPNPKDVTPAEGAAIAALREAQDRSAAARAEGAPEARLDELSRQEELALQELQRLRGLNPGTD
ncbi:hypothetical protein DWB68_01770 [Galactobacter valiniphilus]|uniref:Uncharacterized protein n=1 Tax=Galactobacter valiniphilus TaxID=2676122 RepID=A0A399JCU9_9MICC|nr:hypothetical protein [Galactobacter valiniphilus]RII43358.1 hypothetical protein DWB68_01770 [Galactobacter valiniphilus]